jgi:hypothetical protein
VVRTDPRNADDHGRIYLPADPSLVSMATTITKEVRLLPPPITIVNDPQTGRPVAVRRSGEDDTALFAPISSVGERGHATDTGHRVASDELVEMARAYVQRKHLTASDPVSLALAASENPALRDAIERALRDEE